eukprot:COSAG05_NODE_108_length_18693_cov_7.956709_10_plen_71_part_00
MGRQGLAEVDSAGVLLDCGAGSLTLHKNRQLLSVAVANGVVGDLHGAIAVCGAGTVRLAVLPPQNPLMWG